MKNNEIEEEGEEEFVVLSNAKDLAFLPHRQISSAPFVPLSMTNNLSARA